MDTYSSLIHRDESYISLVPREIIELIVYRLNFNDMQSFRSLGGISLDWSIIFSYRFKFYKDMGYGEYLMWLDREKVYEFRTKSTGINHFARFGDALFFTMLIICYLLS